LKGSLRERVRCSPLVDWPVYPRLAHTMRASNDAQCGPTQAPNASNPSHSARNHARLANPAGGVSSNIPSTAPKHLGCLFCATETAEDRRAIWGERTETPGLKF
jgi:hypothetical protein